HKLARIDHRFSWRPQHWWLVALVSVVCTAAIVWLYITRIKFEIIFLPPFVGRPPTPEYATFSPKHLLDIVNLSLILLPGLGALLAAGASSHKESSRSPIGVFMLLCFAASLLFVLVIDPQLGMERDWDLMSFTLFPLVLYLVYRTSMPSLLRSGRPVVGYIVVTMLITTSYIAANIEVAASEARYLSLLRYYATKERSGWSILVTYYQDKGDTEHASQIQREMAGVFPDYRRLMDAYAHLNSDDYGTAYQIADSLVRQYPYNPDFLQIYANCLGQLGRFKESESYFQRTLAIRPHSAVVENEFAQMYLKSGALHDALETFRAAHEDNPNLTFVSEGFGLAYFRLGQLDSAGMVADSLFQADPHSPGGHLLKMVIAIKQGDLTAAREHLGEFKRYGRERSDYSGILQYYAYLER
ncbi:MAG TPA: hypothetical protein VMS71_08325, partial [Candidatus Acidoferrum sp.]|nr:hypothetical protein [Candidatus Acidoferrum sp.]